MQDSKDATVGRRRAESVPTPAAAENHSATEGSQSYETAELRARRPSPRRSPAGRGDPYGALTLVAPLALMLVAGCAQSTEAPVDQPARVIAEPVADQAAQGSGSVVTINVGNDIAREAMDEGGATITLGAEGLAETSEPRVADGAAGVAAKKTRGAQNNFAYIVVHTGGSSTGAQSTGATGPLSNAPNATISQSPEQHPEASVQVPIGVALPGGFAAPSAAGGTGQAQTSLTPQQSATLTTLWQQAASGSAEALRVLETFLAALRAQSTPASQPAAP